MGYESNKECKWKSGLGMDRWGGTRTRGALKRTVRAIREAAGRTRYQGKAEIKYTKRGKNR